MQVLRDPELLQNVLPIDQLLLDPAHDVDPLRLGEAPNARSKGHCANLVLLGEVDVDSEIVPAIDLPLLALGPNPFEAIAAE